ncbi:MAG: transporter substrate-binding domain-containing protein [Fibrobacterales bacterium]
MNVLNYTLALLAVVLLATSLWSQETEKISADDLNYMTEDYAPANYMENDTLKGFSVDLLHALWDKMGYSAQPIQMLPWARGYNYVQTKDNQVLFTMGMTKERRNLFKWVGPIFSAKQVLVMKKSHFSEMISLEEAQKLSIGVIRGDITIDALKGIGVKEKQLQSVSDVKQNFKKLSVDRVDAIAYTEDGFNQYIALNNIDPRLYTVAFVIKETQQFYAFSKTTPDYLIRQFQQALKQISKEHYSILRKYGMVK